MKANIIRLMLIVNGGWGNPNQYRLITPPIGNHDLFAVNVDNENTNFVLFTRPRIEFQRNNEKVGLDNGDTLNIFDYMYELACKTYAASDKTADEKFMFSIDFSGASFLEREFLHERSVSLEGIGTYAVTPNAHRFAEIMRSHARLHGCPLDVDFALCNYRAEDCKKFFFPQCDRLESGECCKFQK